MTLIRYTISGWILKEKLKVKRQLNAIFYNIKQKRDLALKSWAVRIFIVKELKNCLKFVLRGPLIITGYLRCFRTKRATTGLRIITVQSCSAPGLVWEDDSCCNERALSARCLVRR